MSGLVTFLSGTTHVFREIFRVTCCLTSNFSTLNSTFACQFSASLKTRLQCRSNLLSSTLNLFKFLSEVSSLYSVSYTHLTLPTTPYV